MVISIGRAVAGGTAPGPRQQNSFPAGASENPATAPVALRRARARAYTIPEQQAGPQSRAFLEEAGNGIVCPPVTG
jgi:hypothetical protein